MGEVIQLQGDQRKDVQEFLTDKKEGLELDAKTIKVSQKSTLPYSPPMLTYDKGPRFLSPYIPALLSPIVARINDRSTTRHTKYFLPASPMA
jgi:hypothetical protein